MLYNYAPLILTIAVMTISLTGYYLLFVCHANCQLLIWLIISAALTVTGFTAGKLIQRLNLASHTDFLTGLWNKRYFHLKLNTPDKNIPLCVALIDLDDFKKINDIHGHFQGDILLAKVADILRENTRKSDIVARWGGDEFAVIFLYASLPNAYRRIEQIRCKIENTFRSSFGLTISAGLMPLEPGQNLQKVLIKADQALYNAKMLKNSVIKAPDLEKNG